MPPKKDTSSEPDELPSQAVTDKQVCTVSDHPEVEKCSPWLLFAMPITLGLLLSFVVVFVDVLRSIDSRAFYLGLDGLRPWLFSCAVLSVACIAGLLYFRPKFRTILVASMFLVGCGVTMYQFVRVESFYGNMVPRLAWAWTPTAEQKVESYFVSRDSSRSGERQPILRDASLFWETQHDFPGFLGQHRNGHVANAPKLAGDWEQNRPELLWKHPVGLGWSSFAVVGRAGVTLEQRGELECVVCYDVESGEQLWIHEALTRFNDEHGDGPRSTPTVVAGKVYSMGATGRVACLDLRTGDLIWEFHALPDEQSNLLWGMSGSPLVVGGKVYVTPGQNSSNQTKSAGSLKPTNSLVCLDAESGSEVWRSGSSVGAYASPMFATLCGIEVILSFHGGGLQAFAAADGRELWLVPWLTQGERQRVNVAQPIVIPENGAKASRILISSGYGQGTTLIRVRCTGDQWTTEELWHSIRLRSKMSNFVTHKQYIYGLDSGILTCLDLETGKRQWKRGRYGHGQLLLAQDKLIVQAESGKVVLVKATPEMHNEAGSIQALDGKTWNHMALAGDLLVVRNDHEAAAFRLPTKPVDGEDVN